ncbi:hypothetical protein WICPIJ_009369 [Wickerhamomyces pijperi]|uniref:Cytochrome b5 heme-binding domain-containing protein n=1 Tax=Wickerhamomyces pijperi TaxID=599730 RepID=A0A9P8PME9_WICPI|nr:hypothetical protein WICPIJ_009369 [Wickerhamomyces pijperi]
MIIYDQLSKMIHLRQREETTAASKRTAKDTADISPKGEGSTNVKIKTYSLDEIAQHNTAEDLWMIIHNKVYDVTSIIDQHPGGAEVLFDFAGGDGTVPFDDVGHSQDSVEMLRPLFLGIVSKDDESVSEIVLTETHGIISNDKDEILMKIDDEFDEELAPGIKYYNILGIESEKNNSSLGQSAYWKRYIQKKKEQKQGKSNYLGLTERSMNICLIIIAILALFGFIYIQKLKADHRDLHEWLYD